MPKRIPNLEEIPSGICECGCGQKTEIATNTWTKIGKFAGYPNRYKRGHSPAIRKKGKEHFNYKSGKYIVDGYVKVLCPDNPASDKDGYIFEHRLTMAQHIGRPLSKEEHIHHINGNRQDNRIENLQIVSISEHIRLHMLKWTREKILLAFQEFRNNHGSLPNTGSANMYGGGIIPTHTAVKRIFGTWQNAIDAAFPFSEE